MNRHDLSDAQWARLQPLLPPHKPHTGRPNLNHRLMINGMLWVDRTGAPWRDMPERYGKASSVSSRFYRWRQAGVWQRILAALQQQADQCGTLNWEVHYVDATIIRAHQHAAGAKGSDAEAEALGRSQGGFSTKVHVRAEGHGKPLVFILTAGQRHESIGLEALMHSSVKRPGRGQPRRRPK